MTVCVDKSQWLIRFSSRNPEWKKRATTCAHHLAVGKRAERQRHRDSPILGATTLRNVDPWDLPDQRCETHTCMIGLARG